MKSSIPYLNEWLELERSGKFDKANEIYFDKLFDAIIDNFVQFNSNRLPNGGVLFSTLGFSPEPIILTAKAIKPENHLIFSTNIQEAGSEYLERYLEFDYELIRLKEDSFDAIYRAFKEQLVLNPSSQVTLDITGGKKSMVASAAIFGKDYGCRIVYVDFAEYIKDLRKPMPGSENLHIVYDPFRNQPEIFIK